MGIGFGVEESAGKEGKPNLAIGLADAMRAALSNAGVLLPDVTFRVGGMTGERRAFMEASTALARIQRVHRDGFELWVPAEMLGDVGASLGACMLVVTAVAFAKGYAPGDNALLHVSSRSRDRAACVVSNPRGEEVMGNDVYANGREISCKSGNAKVTAAFPDVCLTPPPPPAGPLPIPYPLFSFDSDTTSGSKKVKIGGKEVMLKDKSYFKKCTGDEAATKSQGQGVITHTITGKVYFIAWSMDVIIEGENAVRHLDMTTSNHASPLGNESAPWPELAKQAFENGPCKGCDEKLKLQEYSEPCPRKQRR